MELRNGVGNNGLGRPVAPVIDSSPAGLRARPCHRGHCSGGGRERGLGQISFRVPVTKCRKPSGMVSCYYRVIQTKCPYFARL